MRITEQDFEQLEKLNFWTDITHPVLWQLPAAMEDWVKEKSCNNPLLPFLQLIAMSHYNDNGELRVWEKEIFQTCSDQDLQTIYQNRDKLKHSRLKATFLQIMWQYRKLGKGSHLAAKEAIQAYLSSVESLLEAHERGEELITVEIKDTLNHLHSLALQIKDQEAVKTIIKKILTVIKKSFSAKDPPLILCMFQLLAYTELGDGKEKPALNRIVKIIPKIPKSEFYQREWFYDCAIKFAHDLKDQKQEIKLKKSKAKIFLAQAKMGHDSFFKAFHLQRAIDVYKTIPNSASLWRPLMLKLDTTLQQGKFETHPIHIPEVEEIQKDIEIASLENEKEFTENLAGTSLETKLCFLISLLSLPTQKDIEKGLPKGTSIEDLIPTTIHDDKGHPIRTMKGEIPKEKMAFIRTILDRWDLLCNLHLGPVVRIIKKEHHITAQTLLPYCTSNPFIPHGHEHIFALGLSYFIKGQFIEAGSILIPQIENSFRKILEAHTPTFHIKKHIFEDTIEMDGLIKKLAALNIIPERFIFNFQMLFIERAINVRNNIAHGKSRTRDFFTAPAVIPLWMILWFVMYPFTLQKNSEK